MDQRSLSLLQSLLYCCFVLRNVRLDIVSFRARMNMENKNRKTQTEARPTTKRLQKEEEHNTDMCTWVRERETRL